jgi:hypothetical protein
LFPEGARAELSHLTICDPQVVGELRYPEKFLLKHLPRTSALSLKFYLWTLSPLMSSGTGCFEMAPGIISV